MAKNRCQLERPLETHRPGAVIHYVRLVPVEALILNALPKLRMTIVTHYTTDADAFRQQTPAVASSTSLGAR